MCVICFQYVLYFEALVSECSMLFAVCYHVMNCHLARVCHVLSIIHSSRPHLGSVECGYTRLRLPKGKIHLYVYINLEMI